MRTRVGLLVGVGLLPVLTSGCLALSGVPLGSSSSGKTLPERQIAKLFHDYEGAGSVVGVTITIADPRGRFAGTVVTTTGPAKPAFAPLEAFRKARVAGRFSGGLVSAGAEDVTVRALAVVSAPASSVCVSLTGRSVGGYGARVVRGSFTVVGGAGPVARLRASGTFLSVVPKTDSTGRGRVTMRVELRPAGASLGSPRPLTAACRAAAKRQAKPPPPATATARFVGFAFAPAGAAALPPATQIFPGGATVFGAFACGSSLYAVVRYAGPATTTDGALFGPAGTISVQHQVVSGSNLLPLLANPPNGSYTLKLGFQGVAGPLLAASLSLARTC